MFQSPAETLQFIKDTDVKFVDLRLSDLPGAQHHFNVPAQTVDVNFFSSGQMFDSSSLRGFASIHESDMQLIPDVRTAYIDPFRKARTLIITCDIVDPRTGDSYERDPRLVAKRAEKFLADSGIADTAFFGAEAEFYVFDHVRHEVTPRRSLVEIDSNEAYWNSGATRDGQNLAHTINVKGGYFPVSPQDKQADLRDEISLKLIESGLKVERAHHEVGAPGQAEINYRFDTLLKAADDMQKFKYIVKNTATEFGKTATFMPKPVFGDNGSGMHTHMSLWQNSKPIFYDASGYAGLSDVARWYVGGILHHAPSLLAFTNPSTNSYRRLVKGFEAPVNLVFSEGNRSAAIRIPITGDDPKAKRIEFRAPDASANPYLAFAAQLMAGIDGIKKQIEPPAPIDKDLYSLSQAESAQIKSLPSTLDEALACLEADHEYLLAGGVFTKALLDAWIDMKNEQEINPMSLRPHPYEFELYYGV